MLTLSIQARCQSRHIASSPSVSDQSRYARVMSENQDLERDTDSAQSGTEATQASKRPERRGPPPNPLYHPLFLPVLLIAFSLWFGYDGFLTSDPEMLDHQNFNRIMFAIMLPICVWMVPKGIKEFREDQAKAAREHSSGKSA